MNDLIPISNTAINEVETLTCDARALHGFLEVETRFNDWIKRRIEKYGFIEGQDYIKIINDFTVLKNEYLSPNDFQASTDYTLTIDMAKQLAMVENNEKGVEVRRYFIQCERIAKEAASTPKSKNRRADGDISARSAAVSYRMLARMNIYPVEMRAVFAAKSAAILTGEPLSALLPPIKDNREKWLSPTALGKYFNVSAQKIGNTLKSLNLHGSSDAEHSHSQAVWDKSPYSDKQVVSYLYDPAIVLPQLANALDADSGKVLAGEMTQ